MSTTRKRIPDAEFDRIPLGPVTPKQDLTGMFRRVEETMSTTDKATPRPWHISGENVGILISPKDAVYGYAVATACGLATDPETQANAELIVRAVNERDDLIKQRDALVALARDLLTWDEETEGIYSEHNPAIRRFCEQARQCLKLA